MQNTNALQQVVHEIFEDLSTFYLFCPLLGSERGHPLYLNKSESQFPRHISYKDWLKLAKWFMRESCLF